MILYSIVPPEVVFAHNSNPEGATMIIDYLGEKVEVRETGDHRYSILRVISTSPKAYLNPKLQPGTIISVNRSGSGN